ncbi:unnamed protein product [Effrenium voratum]|nr:unnamed protein product [Effrenium voratum]
MSAPWLGPRTRYEEFLARQLPQGVPPERFAELIAAMEGIDIGAWMLDILVLLGVSCSLFLAAPSRAMVNVRSSRRVIWCSWLLAFLPNFLLFLVFPLRAMVDWKAITADVCFQSVMNTLTLPGSQLRWNLKLLEDAGILEESMQGITDAPRAWCMAQGSNWHESFFNQSVPCVWLAEDKCREEFCHQAPAAFSSQCLMGCVQLVFTQFQQARPAVMEAMTKCDSQVAQKAYSPTNLRAQASDVGFGAMDEADIMNSMLSTQRLTIIGFSESMTWASIQAEYAVGVLVSMMVGQSLIAAALGLASGFSEALLNLKAMFPGNQAGGWLLMLSTFQVVPIYMVIFATFQQLLGDGILALAMAAATLYLSLGMHTGYRITSTDSGEKGRWRLYRLVWVEYGLRGLFASAGLAALLVWVLQKGLTESLLSYIRADLLTPFAIASMVADFFARKALTAVAGTDAMVSAFVQTETTWRMRQEAETKGVLELHSLVEAKVYEVSSLGKE